MSEQSASSSSTHLLNQYEALRREEYELFVELIQTLSQVDGADPALIDQVRDALFHADHPYLLVMVGPFSSGKSTLLNALLGQARLLPVGPTPTTDKITFVRYGEQHERVSSGGGVDTVFLPSPLLRHVSVVDTPGLESIFKHHEQETRRFLHRCDTVFMVMLATQAMSLTSLNALNILKTYGKRIIILLNQADLLTSEEQQTVLTYVHEQSKDRLGYLPEVWLVSGKQGVQAGTGENRDATLWKQSGIDNIERYISEQLSDVVRLKTKLLTPLQIAENASQSTLMVLQSRQSILDGYQGISTNIQKQIKSQRGAFDGVVEDYHDKISIAFGDATLRGSEAIRERFHISQGLVAVLRGTLEIFRLGGLLRPTVRAAFERRHVFDPLDRLDEYVDSLSATLEGYDMRDIGDLVKYGRERIAQLPKVLQDKVIGEVAPPIHYDRSYLLNQRATLMNIEDQARDSEIERLDSILQNTVVYMAIFELTLFALLSILSTVQVANPSEAIVGLLLLLVITMLLGMLAIPLRGWMLERVYTQRMQTIQRDYWATLQTALQAQIDYGTRLRSNSVLPLTRLIDAQFSTQSEQVTRLQGLQQKMSNLEKSLNNFGKRPLFANLGGS